MNSVKYFFFTIILLLSLNVKSQDLQINEVVSKNYNGIVGFDGETEDWIEIYNSSTDTINLQDYFLSDDESNLQLWQFPNLEIFPDSFVLVFASDKDVFFPEMHSSFKIKSEGEKLFLSKNNIVDSISIPSLKADYSYGRINEQSNEWSILDVNTPGFSNISSNHLIFSHQSGFYEDDIILEVEQLRPNQNIHYTLDGSEPNASSAVFNGSILIDDRSYLPNGISEIRTSPDENVFYHNWSKPEIIIPKSTCIQLTSFNNSGERTSAFYSKSFWIDKSKKELKTISLFIDSLDLFNEQDGIYVPGHHYNKSFPNSTGNYFLDKAVVAKIVIIDKDNQEILNDKCEIKIQGKATRASAQKSLKIYSKKKMGAEYFEARILDDESIEKFKRFVIRNIQGSTTKSAISDELAIEIIKNLNVDYSNYEFCELYINGEYWGVHSLRSKFDDHYFKLKYDYAIEDIIISEADLQTSITGDNTELIELKHFLENNSLANQQNYNYVKEKIDIESFIDYMCAEMFLNNYDWPGNNSKLWKAKIIGSKWRYIFYDLDDTFRDKERNMFNHCTAKNSTSWRNGAEHTLMFRSLLGNQEFKLQFIKRYRELLNTDFSTEETIKALYRIVALMNPEIANNINRWNYPVNKKYWFSIIDDRIASFLVDRPCIVENQLLDFFYLNESQAKCSKKPLENLEILVFPNPNNGNFNFRVVSENISSILDFSIYDSKGQLMYKKTLNPNENNTFDIETNSLSSGVYFIKILNKGIYFGFDKFIIIK